MQPVSSARGQTPGDAGSILRRNARGCGGTGRRGGFRSRWAARPLEVRVLSPASPPAPIWRALIPVISLLYSTNLVEKRENPIVLKRIALVAVAAAALAVPAA